MHNSSFFCSSLVRLVLLSLLAQLLVLPSASAGSPDITISSNGPVAGTLAIGADDATIMNFVIASEMDATFDTFPIYFDFSSDSSDPTTGLLSDASGTPPNLTDIKIVDSDTGEVVFGPVDANSFTTTLGGSTLIDETNDDKAAYYLFTDDLTMTAGVERNLTLTADIAKESALDEDTVYGSLALGTTYPTILDSSGTLLDNSEALVPVSFITSKTMTLAAPSLKIALSSAILPGSHPASAGSEDVDFVAVALTCGVASDCLITQIVTQAYFDDDNDWVYETSTTSAYDPSDHHTTLDSVVGQVWLEDADGNALSSPLPIPSDYRIWFSDLSWTIPAGTTANFYVKGDISSDAFADEDGENIAFGLLNYAYITAQDEDGDKITPTGSANTSKTVYVTTMDISRSDLTMSSVSMGDNYDLSFRIGNSGEDDLDTTDLSSPGVKIRVFNPAGTQVASKGLAWDSIASYTTAGSDKKIVRYFYKYDFLARLKAGKTYIVQVCIDPDDVVEEEIETDNCGTTTFVMSSLPDLAVSDSTYDSSVHSFTTTVANLSSIDVAQIADGYTTLTLNGTEVERVNWKVASSTDVDYLNPGVFQILTTTLEDSELSLLLEGENTWEACVDTENNVVAESSESNNCFTGTFTVDATEPEETAFLEMSIASTTPAENIAVAGSKDVEMTKFNLTATGDSFLVGELTVMNRYDSVPGDMDHNISSVILEYENEAGDLILTSETLAEGEVTFSDLEVYVPLDETVELTVYADLMPIISSGSIATAGSLIELNPTMEGIEATALTTGVAFIGSGETLTGANMMHVYETKVSFGLSSTSPSRSRTVSSSDNAFIFTVTADSGEDVILHDLRIDMQSDADFDTSKTVQARLYEGSILVSSYATVSFVDASTAYVIFTDDYEVPAGSTKTLTLNLSTVDLLEDDAGVDDPLTFFIEYGSSTEGIVTPGGVTWYDGNEEIQWIGNTGSYALISNTVSY